MMMLDDLEEEAPLLEEADATTAVKHYLEGLKVILKDIEEEGLACKE